jgi:hypothetical protein
VRRDWVEADRHHAGCILIWALGHHEFGALIKGVDRPARSGRLSCAG